MAEKPPVTSAAATSMRVQGGRPEGVIGSAHLTVGPPDLARDQKAICWMGVTQGLGRRWRGR